MLPSRFAGDKTLADLKPVCSRVRIYDRRSSKLMCRATVALGEISFGRHAWQQESRQGQINLVRMPNLSRFPRTENA